MNSYIALLGVLLCLVAVNGRHYADRSEPEELAEDSQEKNENIGIARERSAGQMRHRRKRWQMNGYNYQQPYVPFYPEERPYERRDYDRSQEVLPHILRLLDELSSYVRRLPPPPQPIYIPYPVPYYVPQICKCRNTETEQLPNITDRFPQMEDTNQNWGFADIDDAVYDPNDGIRPISFDPLKPIRPTKKPSPSVEHGTNQAADVTTQRPKNLRVPEKCDAAVLSCCRPSDSRQTQKRCFTTLGCGAKFANGDACSIESVETVLGMFTDTYSALSNN